MCVVCFLVALQLIKTPVKVSQLHMSHRGQKPGLLADRREVEGREKEGVSFSLFCLSLSCHHKSTSPPSVKMSLQDSERQPEMVLFGVVVV